MEKPDTLDPMETCQACFQPFVVHNTNEVEGDWPVFEHMSGDHLEGHLCPPKEGYWCGSCETFHANGYPCPKTLAVAILVEENHG